MTQLRREIGTAGAVLLGLGSIIGTGIFVSVGTAAHVAGSMVVTATVIAAFVALMNGLSSAQLAASHPVSGGTYEYGYRYLTPALGFVAGWLFLLAKSASAATAALGFSDYLLAMIGMDRWRIPIAASAVLVLMLLVLRGIKRSNAANAVIVTISVGSLIWFMATGAPSLDLSRVTFFSMERTGDLLEAIALMFVAYTGYGRIATLGEEVKDPEKTIPRAIVAALAISMLLYTGVALIGVGTGAAPLGKTVAIGATAAMLGVVLNLILGLSRVLLAMGRRGDVPPIFANEKPAVIAVSIGILALVLIGDVKTSWSFSAFTVLVYYAITNLAALKLPEPRFPRAIAVGGLLACAFLAFWVEGRIIAAGALLIALGLLLRMGIRHFLGAQRGSDPR